MGTVETVAATPVGSFLAGVGASFLLKLTTSVDDLVWFSPFLARSTSTPQRIKYCAVYVGVCVLVAAAALCLARAAELGFEIAASAIADGEEDAAAAPAPGFWDASRVLRVFAASIIGAYALVELRGWLREGNELPSLRRACRTRRWCPGARGEGAPDAPGAAAQEGHVEFKAIDDSNPMKYRAVDEERCAGTGGASGAAAATAAAVEAPMANEEVLLGAAAPGADADAEDAADAAVQATIRAASRSTYALFAVALCGTVDDMILFAAVVAGKGIPWTAVLPGSLLAAVVVLAACWHISLYAPFANCVQRVPMWALLGAIAAYLFVGVFV